MDLATQRLMQGAAGAGEDKVYVEDVFSTYLYDGNGSTQSINNGIDESGEGALTWIKMRSASGDYHHLYDTERGAGKTIFSNTNGLEQTSDTDRLSAFNSNGFSLGSNYRVNGSGSTFVSWTFRKSPGFFDCMLYNGNNESAFNLSHDLGVIPALIMIRPRSGPFSTARWYVWMKGMSTDKQIRLDTDAEQTSDSNYRVGQNATASSIQIPTGSDVNSGSSGKFVAYVFADGDQSDAQIFGKTGDQQLTKSGSYTGNGSSNGTEVNLGFEPQWLLVKEINGTGNWQIVDSMRGISSDLNDTQLRPNTTQGDDTRSLLDLTPTGFKLTSTNSYWNENGKTYCYFAIRRSDGYVGKPKTAAEVFNVVNDTNTTPRNQVGFPVDMAFLKHSTLAETTFLTGRMLHGAPGKILQTANTNAASNSALAAFDFQNGWVKNNNNMANYRSWNWRRHSGFDVANYTGQNSAFDLYHGLAQIPEMIWFKSRSNAVFWYVYHKDLNNGTNALQYNLTLNSDAAENYQGSPGQILSISSTKVGLNFWSGAVSQNNYTYQALFFSSVSGVSKVGSYTGDGTDDGSKEINLGFSLRYLLIKPANNAGDWYQYDSLTGLSTSGNSTYFQLNDTDAPASGIKSITTTSTGFKVWSTGNSFNANGTRIIYYAHA